jgi:hypothetical protein
MQTLEDERFHAAGGFIGNYLMGIWSPPPYGWAARFSAATPGRTPAILLKFV